MSLDEYARHNFLTLKSCGKAFTFYVTSWRKMNTKFGEGIYLLGERVIKKKTDKQLKGLLKVSPTTISSIGEISDLKTFDELKGMLITFEWDDDVGTVLATAVKEWGQ